MKEQWMDFLNTYEWPYGIVPYLVSRLLVAINSRDDVLIREVLNDLYYQGVAVDSDGNLCFVNDFVLKCKWSLDF